MTDALDADYTDPDYPDPDYPDGSDPDSEDAPKKERPAWPLLKRAWPWVAPDKPLIAGLCLVILVMTPVNLLTLPLTKYLVDEVVPAEDFDMLLKFAGLSFLVLITGTGLSIVQTLLSLRLMARTRFRVSRSVFSHVTRLPLRYHRQTPLGSTMSRVRDDVRSLDGLMPDQLFSFAVAAIEAVAYLGFMFYYDAVLSWTGIIVVATLLAAMFLLFPVLRRLGKASRERDAAASANLNEVLAGIDTTRTSAQTPQERRRFFRTFLRSIRAEVKMAKFSQVVMATVGLWTSGGTFVILAVGAYRISTGAGTTWGELLAFFFALVRMAGNTTGIMGRVAAWQPSLASLERVYEVLDTAQEEESPDARAPAEIHGAVEFRDIGLTYDDGHRALDGFSLQVQPGETLALVGPSGAGKSSLVQLLPRLYDVTDGAVLLDGKDVRELPLRWLRAQIGVVPQDVFLFNRSVRDNIAYAHPEASEEQIVAAARKACADEFIRALPKGYDTKVAERGVRLSGGEKQRIALAREFLRDPPILIMDEATSHLDTLSENLVQQAMDTLSKGRTCIIIAHRLSTVRKADRIAVMQHGQLQELGNHEELLTQDGLYKKLHDLQWF